MGIVGIFKQSWKLYTKHFVLFLRPVLLLLIPSLIAFGLEASHYRSTGIEIVLSLITLFVGYWMQAVIVLSLNSLIDHKTPEVETLYPTAMSKVGRLLAVDILSGLAVLLGLVLLIVPGLILAVWFAFAAIMVILENKRGIAALRASKELVRGYFGQALAQLVIPTVVFGAVTLLFCAGIITIVTRNVVQLTDVAFDPTFGAFTTLVFTALTPLFISVPVIVYRNLKSLPHLAKQS